MFCILFLTIFAKINIDMNRKVKKEIRQRIKEAQANCQTNKAIYDKLSEEYEDEKDEIIARLIVTTLKPKDKKKHYVYTGILLGFTAVAALLNIWVIKQSPFPLIDVEFLRFMYESHGYMSIVWHAGGNYVFFYAIVLSIICKRRITSYIFWMYTCSYLTFLFLLNVLVTWTIVWGIYWLYAAIDILFIISIIFLARFFQRKIFPDYRYRRLKKDENGGYVFS